MSNEKILRALDEGNFEVGEEGILVPSARVMVEGQFSISKRGEAPELSSNLVVTEGLIYLLASALRGVTAIPSWFIAIFSGAVNVDATWDADNFTANSTEITAYTLGTRVPWTPIPVVGGLISSYTAKSEFTANAAITVRGAGLLSSSVKGGQTGELIGASRFLADKVLADTEILDVGYQLTLTPTP